MIEAFKKNVDYLSKRGSKQKFNVIDSVALNAIITYFEKEDISLQLVKPHNHQANTAECVTQTFKHHFISGICIADKKLPTILWSRLINQAAKTPIMLRTSCVYLNVLAYHVLKGAHDFD